MEQSSVPPLLAHDDTVFEGLRGPMDLIREQRRVDSRLAPSRVADLETVLKDFVVVPATAIQRSTTVDVSEWIMSSFRETLVV